MWSPTHIQVTVNRAKKLLTKGKNGTNNCFVTIALGKEKYQTSVKEKSIENVDWHEECELAIPERGNRAELVLTCLHRNNLSMDEFLGQITLPLQEMDMYEQPRSKWYTLESKPGKDKKKERGQLEIRILFTVKAGSLTDLSKKEKHKSSFGQLASSVGGSLLSIGTLEKRKGIKKFAKSLGSKMHISGKSKKNKDGADSDSFTGSFASIDTPNSSIGTARRFGGQQYADDADPGVISEDDDEFVFDNLSHKSSGSSLNLNKNVQLRNQNQQQRIPSPLLSKEDINLRSRTLPAAPTRNPSDTKLDEWQQKLYGKHLDVSSTDSLKRRSWNVPLANTKEESEDFINQEILMSEPEKEQNNKEKTFVEESEQIYDPVVQEQSPSPSPSTPKKSTAPTIPIKKSIENLHEIHIDQPTEKFSPKPPVKPNPLPRAATAGNLLSESVTKNLPKKPEKQKDNDNKKLFSKLINNFRKEGNEISTDGIVRFGERINPIGHENNFKKPYSSVPELSPELLNKYDGKSREEVIVIAHGLETDVLVQRNRVKELEDYLDNLLLRVMETHPKILQNPYRTTSIKREIESEYSRQWNHDETKLLIKIRLSHEYQFVNDKRKKSILWDEVLQDIKLVNSKFPYDQKEINKKFVNLMITYKRIIKRSRESGKNSTSWEYFNDFDNVYKWNDIITDESPYEYYIEPFNFEEYSVDQTKYIKPKRKRKIQEILDFLEKESENDERRHQELISIEREKIEIEKKRLNLLNSLVNVLHNFCK